MIAWPTFQKAVNTVNTEMGCHGFWTTKVESTEVILIPFPHFDVITAEGFFFEGNIYVPKWTWGKIGKVLTGRHPGSLNDLIRHEYGHAVVHHHRGLFRSAKFTDAFEAPISDWEPWDEYDPEVFVSEYATTAAEEDFCETFMCFLRHRGKIPRRFDTPSIRAKWRFCRDVGRALKRGLARW